MQKIGTPAFQALDKSKVTLISTYEPCQMCQGALLEYHIKDTRYLLQKTFIYKAMENLRSLRYQWLETNAGPDAIQRNLFSQYLHTRP